MEKELLVFVPGLTARVPDKYTGRLIRNLENYAQRRGGEWVRDQPDAGAAVAYTYRPASDGARPCQIVFREVVWGDIPTRLSEQPARVKFGQGFSLLGWVGGSLLRAPFAFFANKYQLACMLGALLVLIFWYLSVLVVFPTAVNYALLPEDLTKPLQAVLGASAEAITDFSVLGVQVWVVTSFLMGLLPVTAVVDAAYGMKQYVRDERGEGDTGLVGEEARARIAKALTELRKEHEAAMAAAGRGGNGPGAYRRVTILAHSFGAVPTVEELHDYGRPLGVPIRLVTLGAPLRLAGVRRPTLAKAAEALRKPGVLTSWHCLWSRRDYLSSEPEGEKSARFKPEKLGFSWSLWPLANHARYFDDDRVAEVLLAPPEDGARAARGRSGGGRPTRLQPGDRAPAPA
jgi:hypothetical protein